MSLSVNDALSFQFEYISVPGKICNTMKKWTDFFFFSDSWCLLQFLSKLGINMWLVKHMVCSSEFFGAVQSSEESYLSGIP